MGMDHKKVWDGLLHIEEGRALRIWRRGIEAPFEAAHDYVRDDAPVWVVFPLMWRDTSMELSLDDVAAFSTLDRNGFHLFVWWPRDHRQAPRIGTREEVADWDARELRYRDLCAKRANEGVDALTDDEKSELYDYED